MASRCRAPGSFASPYKGDVDPGQASRACRRYVTDCMTSSGQPHKPQESSFLAGRQVRIGKAGLTEPLNTNTVMADDVGILLIDTFGGLHHGRITRTD